MEPSIQPSMLNLPEPSRDICYREISPCDWHPIYKYWKHESFYKYRAVPIPDEAYVRREVQRYVETASTLPRKDYYFAIVERSS